MALDIRFDISGNHTTNGPYTIYDLEIRVFQSLNDFNAVYAQYLRCSNNIPDTERDPQINQIMRENTHKTNCPSSPPTKQQVTAAYEKLIQTIGYYEAAYTTIAGTSDANPPMDMADLEEKYKSVLQLRNELDVKTAEIEKGKDSQYSNFKERYDSTMYIQIILTILMISLIYYMFLHM